MTTDTKPLAERLRRWRSRAEEGAATLPAKGSVKVHPTDWYCTCVGLTEAADALDAQAALLREAAEALRPNIAHTSIRALLSRIEATLLSEPSPSNSGDTP